ncbi:MAG: hypothetical protein Q9178_007186 [Gyalolechia marmorata]
MYASTGPGSPPLLEFSTQTKKKVKIIPKIRKRSVYHEKGKLRIETSSFPVIVPSSSLTAFLQKGLFQVPPILELSNYGLPMGYNANGTTTCEFACVTCDEPTVKNELAVPADRWKAAHGDDAWTQITRWWTVLRDSGDKPLGAITGFVPSISWYWQGPEQWDCASIGETFCSSVVKCSDAQIPAASMTLTSFANIHMFSKTFAPQGPDTLKLLKILLDVFALSYGLIGAGVWNKMLRETPIFKDKGDNLAWAKDSANAAVTSSVILAKDASPTLEGAVATLNDLTRVLGVLVDGWAEVTSTYVKQLFSGSDEAITQLGTYITGGDWYSTDIETGLFSLQGIMENVLYGQLIPRAWGERAAVNPVIVFQSESDVENPLTVILRDSDERTLSNEVCNPLVP